MIYIYLITALIFAFFSCCVNGVGIRNNLLLRFPAILGCVTYGILVAKGFGLI